MLRKLMLLFPLALGCTPNGPPVETIPITVVDPLGEVKSLLNNYANGSPVTSEAASFPELVERVKSVSAEKGALVEAAFQKISDNPREAKKVATELLKQL